MASNRLATKFRQSSSDIWPDLLLGGKQRSTSDFTVTSRNFCRYLSRCTLVGDSTNSKNPKMPAPILLAGPYLAPRLRKGSRTQCLYRDAEIVITSMSNGRTPWPRCRAVGSRGGSGLLVDDELARAVRTESAEAIMYWWGVSCSTVWLWRLALGVDRLNNPGSQRLIRRNAKLGAEAIKRKEFTAEEREVKRQLSIRLNTARHLKPGYHGRWWTKRELAVLGQVPDDAAARQTGRSVNANRQRRELLGRPRIE